MSLVVRDSTELIRLAAAVGRIWRERPGSGGIEQNDRERRLVAAQDALREAARKFIPEYGEDEIERLREDNERLRKMVGGATDIIAGQTAAVRQIAEPKRAAETKKLTRQQVKELRALSYNRQHTYGSGRARIQNNLVYAGLARYEDDDGNSMPVVEWSHGMPFKTCPSWCLITDAGREYLSKMGDHVR